MAEPLDYSKLTDEELAAIAAGNVEAPDMSKLSDDQLKAIAGTQEAAPANDAPPKDGKTESENDLRIRLARLKRNEMGPAMRYVDTGVRGLARAVPFMDDIAALGDTAIGRGEGEQFGDRYLDNLRTQRAINEVDDTDRPVTSYGGQVAGSLALPVGPAAKAVSLPAKIGAGAMVGGGYGALYGLGQGEGLEDRLKRALWGGGAGTLIGGAVPPLAAGAKLVGDAAKRGALNTAGYVRDPADEALRRVRLALSRDAESGNLGLSADDIALARATDQLAVVGDIGGETTRALARSAANTSPEGRQALMEATGDRFATQGERTRDFLRGLMDTDASDPAEFAVALQQRARSANKPKYDAAYAEADEAAKAMPDGLWGDDFALLAQSPDFKDAMMSAAKRGANRAVSEGAAPPRAPFVMDDAGNIVLAGEKDGQRALPNLAYWDKVKQALDATIAQKRREGDKNYAADLSAVRDKLVSRLDEIAPSYAEARGSAASFFRAGDAYEAGSNLVGMNKGLDLGKAKMAIDKMDDPERALLREGYLAEKATRLNALREGVDVTKQSSLSSPLSRQKDELVLGKDRAAALDGFIRREQVMDRLRTALGNSTTSRQLVELGLAGGAGGAAGLMAGQDMSSAGLGSLVGLALKSYKGKVDPRIAEHVGKLLASDDPKVFLKGMKIVQENPSIAKAFGGIEATLSKIGGQTGENLTEPKYATGGDVDLKEVVRKLKAKGRGEDSLLAHINPREAVALKRAGGSGKINPKTGIIEFDDGDDSGGATGGGASETGNSTSSDTGPGGAAWNGDMGEGTGGGDTETGGPAADETEANDAFGAGKGPGPGLGAGPGGHGPMSVSDLDTPDEFKERMDNIATLYTGPEAGSTLANLVANIQNPDKYLTSKLGQLRDDFLNDPWKMAANVAFNLFAPGVAPAVNSVLGMVDAPTVGSVASSMMGALSQNASAAAKENSAFGALSGDKNKENGTYNFGLARANDDLGPQSFTNNINGSVDLPPARAASASDYLTMASSPSSIEQINISPFTPRKFVGPRTSTPYLNYGKSPFSFYENVA